MAATAQDSVADLIARVVAADPGDRMPLQEALVTAAVDDLSALTAAANPAHGGALGREVALWALGELGTDSACQAVAELAREPAEELGARIAAATASGRCGEPGPLRALLEEESAVARAKASIILGLLGDIESRDAIAAFREDETMGEFRTFVELALGLLGDLETVELLEALLSTRPARHQAAIALARMGRSTAMIDIRLACRNPDPLLRHQAMIAYAAQRWEGARAVVGAAVSDPNPRIAAWAARQDRLWEHLGD